MEAHAAQQAAENLQGVGGATSSSIFNNDQSLRNFIEKGGKVSLKNGYSIESKVEFDQATSDVRKQGIPSSYVKLYKNGKLVNWENGSYFSEEKLGIIKSWKNKYKL